jgi:hypothetical protein
MKWGNPKRKKVTNQQATTEANPTGNALIRGSVNTNSDTTQTTGKPTKRDRKGPRLLARLCLGLLFLAGLFFSLLPQGRAAVRSSLLLPAILSASQAPIIQIFGEPITHSQRTISSLSGPVYLDIYEPKTAAPLLPHTRSGVLVFSGSGDNRQDPQLVNLLEILAHSGMIVMNMTTTTMINYDLSALDADAAVQSFKTLLSLPSMKGNRASIISFSAGVPFACFAAADPRIRDQVASVTVFGGYFQTVNVLRAFGHRSIIVDGRSEAWEPAAVPLEVLTNVITKAFTFDEQTSIRNAILGSGPRLSSSDLEKLSPPARAAYHLLAGDDPGEVDANIALLPPSIHMELTALSPSQIVGQIHAPVFLLHDRHDTSIPFTESRAFATTLSHLHHPYDYVEFNIFNHVEVRSNLNIGELVGDGSHLFNILTQIMLLGSQ